jgi:hypothetical protein
MVQIKSNQITTIAKEISKQTIEVIDTPTILKYIGSSELQNTRP